MLSLTRFLRPLSLANIRSFAGVSTKSIEDRLKEGLGTEVVSVTDNSGGAQFVLFRVVS